MRVAQCWDDSVSTDLRVMEICRKHGAKATFNLNPGLMEKNRRGGTWEREGEMVQRFSLSELRSVYEEFTVANHTMTHPHPTQIAPEAFRAEVRDARNLLEDIFQREVRGFAWPFGDFDDECVKILRDCGIVYGRTTRYTEDVSKNAEPLTLASSCHFLNPDFEKIRDRALETGVFYFWGHSFEMCGHPELWAQYERRIAALSDDPKTEWVDVMDLAKSPKQ